VRDLLVLINAHRAYTDDYTVMVSDGFRQLFRCYKWSIVSNCQLYCHSILLLLLSIRPQHSTGSGIRHLLKSVWVI